ncbi:hypothetical protein RRG08_042512 [Elysia crispata]|uniref:Uncharacterized protein n=1 Tax=Elysia crispata TaxID=231223 RepID=A0AAE1CK06_9GAST|nr:hypothetical protein RRG08_042512 [Elysia crispata]
MLLQVTSVGYKQFVKRQVFATLSLFSSDPGRPLEKSDSVAKTCLLTSQSTERYRHRPAILLLTPNDKSDEREISVRLITLESPLDQSQPNDCQRPFHGAVRQDRTTVTTASGASILLSMNKEKATDLYTLLRIKRTKGHGSRSLYELPFPVSERGVLIKEDCEESNFLRKMMAHWPNIGSTKLCPGPAASLDLTTSG